MNLTEYFESIFVWDDVDYPEGGPFNKNLSSHINSTIYKSFEGIKKQFNRTPGRYGLVWYFTRADKDHTFQLLSLSIDKATMYLEKVDKTTFRKSFLFHRPDVVRDLKLNEELDGTSELNVVLREEYNDSYHLYTNEIFNYTEKQKNG